MDSKLGTELNVALDTDERLREDSLSLNVGYSKEFNSWSLIVRYSGDLSQIADEYGLIATELLGNFGILEIPQEKITQVSLDDRIIYIEKPKEYNQERADIKGFRESCMNVPYFDYQLKGKGVTVAIIDSGIDVSHNDFIAENNDGVVSKVIGIWDQSLLGNPPAGYNIGTYLGSGIINSSLRSEAGSFPSVDVSGHGTAVAGIVTACVPDASLLIVKLDTRGKDETDTIALMQGIDFAVRHSIENDVPMVVNLSYGNSWGDHRGNSVLEQYIDVVAGMAKITFVVGSGNDGTSGRHSRIIMNSYERKSTEFQIPYGEGGINIELWKSYQDDISIILKSPVGISFGPYESGQGLAIYDSENMNIRMLGIGPSAINIYDEVFIGIIPLDGMIQEGVWSIELISEEVLTGVVDIWLPVEGATVTDIGFLSPLEYTTLTIPSTTDSVITVGAYDSGTMTYASFSGRGFSASGEIKPDILAPGVDIDTASVGGGYTNVTGTSFATPFVASAAAMLMEYGIVRNNDVFLYGQKVKAYLIAGANPLLGYSKVPNPFTGWGKLCVEDSFPF